MFAALAASVAVAAGPAELVRQPWLPKAPPLAKPAGPVIRVADVEGLYRAAAEVKPGATILLADGHYMMPRYFELHTDNVTMRSESGERDKVVLDGAKSRDGELVAVTGCSGVTIADLTIQNVKFNGFKINSDRLATRVTIYNCVVHNVWQRGIKGPAVPEKDRDRLRPTDCRVQFCLFYNDRPKEYSDDPADTPQNFGGNYVGGMDIMYARRWTISDNVFVGIQGRTREARGAVFLWHDSEDCVIERNVIIDCDSGICLGNSHRGPGTAVHCTRCTVRNNFVTRCPEQGILADYTRDCRIVQNTIHDPAPRLKRLIRLVHDNEGLTVANNLLSGPPMRIETESKVQIAGNVTRDLADALRNAALGDLHLKARTPEVSGAARRLAEAPEDFDREKRRPATDVGADQWGEGQE